MVKLAIITPHGGNTADIASTMSSVASVSNVDLVHIIILNNGSNIGMVGHSDTTVILDVNPVACRSSARNYGLDYLRQNKFSGYVIFLDSGDLLHPSISNVLCDTDAKEVIWGDVLIRSDNADFIKVKLPEIFRKFVNIYYLGSILVHSSLISEHRFSPGRKEDWKFWDTVIPHNGVQKSDQLFSIYTIKSRINHFKRKSALLNDQWNFFRQHRRYNWVESAICISLHYSINVFVWIFLSSKR